MLKSVEAVVGQARADTKRKLSQKKSWWLLDNLEADFKEKALLNRNREN